MSAMQLLRSSLPSLHYNGAGAADRIGNKITTAGGKEPMPLPNGSELRLSQENLVVKEGEEVQVECRIARIDWKDIPRRHARAFIIALDVGAMHLHHLRPDQCVQNKGASTKYICSKPVRWQSSSLQLRPVWFKDGVSRVFLQLVLEDMEVGRDRWTYITGVPISVVGGPVFDPKPRVPAANEDSPDDDDALVAQALAEEEQESALNATLVEEVLAEIDPTEEQVAQRRIARNVEVVAQALADHAESFAQTQLVHSLVAQALDEDVADTEIVNEFLAEHVDAVHNKEKCADALAEHADAIQNSELTSTTLNQHADALKNTKTVKGPLSEHVDAVHNSKCAAKTLADHAEVLPSSELKAAMSQVSQASEDELKSFVDSLSQEARRRLDVQVKLSGVKAIGSASEEELRCIMSSLNKETVQRVAKCLDEVLMVETITKEEHQGVVECLDVVQIARAVKNASDEEIRSVMNSMNEETHQKVLNCLDLACIVKAMENASKEELSSVIESMGEDTCRKVVSCLDQVL